MPRSARSYSKQTGKPRNDRQHVHGYASKQYAETGQTGAQKGGEPVCAKSPDQRTMNPEAASTKNPWSSACGGAGLVEFLGSPMQRD